MLVRQKCPHDYTDEWRQPESFNELRDAFLECSVHDSDGDCVTEIWSHQEVEADESAAQRRREQTSQTTWWLDFLAYRVNARGEVYFRSLDFFLIPKVYERLEPVTPEEEASAIASILGGGS